MRKRPASHSRVAVTGVGCISPLGADLPETVESLRSARDTISPVTAFDVSGCQSKTAGQIPDAWLETAVEVDPRARRSGRASRMMLLAMAGALGGREDFAPDIAVIGTTSGGMTLGEAFYRSFEDGRPLRHAGRCVREYVPQQPVSDAMKRFGLDAPCRILSNACASGTNAIGHAFQLIRAGRARRVLCGGYDALCELVFAGFDSLRASTGEKCRPFDAGRTGLALGEGAAVLLLENRDDAIAGGQRLFAEITGYGCSTDNYHLTQPNPDGSGSRLAMERALASAGRHGAEVDYVNAHGTATPFNDASEARAIQAVCPGAAVSSSKGQMGHSLGAAGAIEAAFCIAAMNEAFLPANINFRTPDEDCRLDIVANQPRSGRSLCALSNSLGFGGANATLVLEPAES